MHVFRPRSLTANALSLWIGFLACVLGCAQPVLSSTKSAHAHLSEPESAAPGDANGTVGSEGPCCHHTRGSQKNKQPAQTISCCPLDATLLQKQDPSRISAIFPPFSSSRCCSSIPRSNFPRSRQQATRLSGTPAETSFCKHASSAFRTVKNTRQDRTGVSCGWHRSIRPQQLFLSAL